MKLTIEIASQHYVESFPGNPNTISTLTVWLEIIEISDRLTIRLPREYTAIVHDVTEP